MTPHELNLHILDHNETQKREHENLIVQAYMTAYWGRFAKRMPNIKKLLGQDKAKNAQTDEEMLEMVKKLNAAFGGTTN